MIAKHHIAALKFLGWFSLMFLGVVAFVAAMCGFGWLVEHLVEHLPPVAWWVFWPSLVTGVAYWVGYELSREQEAADRMHDN